MGRVERDTRQRRAIRQVLEEAGRPLSPQEVWDASHRAVPGLGIATVYRTLKGWVAEGGLRSVELLGEPPRYEAAGKDHHHHFCCQECGKVYEIEGCPRDIQKLTPKGFRLERHELVLYGRCAGCTMS